MTIEIKAEHIRALTPNAVQWIVDGIVANQQAIAAGGIDTPLRLCHFMAQLAHESAHFLVTREYASGEQYEWRQDLGNTQAGDGVRYRGRGLIQTTGRANYRHATTAIRNLNPTAPDFEASPLELEKFPWALLAGITYWQSRNLSAAADRDDVERVTRLINGGFNGLAERKSYLAKAKNIWMRGEAPAGSTGGQAAAADDPHPLLRKGSKGHAVTILQNELIEAGLKVFPDGDFGQHTEDAVKVFQTSRGLDVDGIVGQATWDALIANRG
jgi:putative chitinase